MEILGIGPLEFLFILLIIFLVMGPEDMQKTARTLGRWLRRLMASETWRSLTHTRQTLRTLPNRLAREAGLEESLRDMEIVQKELHATTENLARSLIEAEANRLYPDIPTTQGEGNEETQSIPLPHEASAIDRPPSVTTSETPTTETAEENEA